MQNSNTLYIPIGLQCITPKAIKDLRLRTNSYPFDWIISNPYFVYKMLYLLLEDNMDINEIVREHFLRNDHKCGHNRIEHYFIIKNGNGDKKHFLNELYNVVFAHEEYNEETINKYIRRFERLKENILNNSLNIQFIYVSQLSLRTGNFTINGKPVIENVYENMNNIIELVKKYNKNSNIILFDTIQNEDINILNKEITLYKISASDKNQLLRRVTNGIKTHLSKNQ